MDDWSVLRDTPYSLPDEATSSLAEMSARLRRARAGLVAALAHASSMGLVREMDRAHAYWSVFESNSIEFEGPDLAGTVEAIEKTDVHQMLRDLNISLLPELLRQDKRAFAAVGLETARLLALRYIGPDSRGLSQSDVRSLHSVVMAGSWFAGAYRQFDVEITQSEHQPFPTFDIDFAMEKFTDWSHTVVDPDEAILRAAVGHAWFTHVHPFQDGNGRVARLLTNVMLGQDGLPPAIVKARSQRTKYIAALAHSDEGGDIMPLAGLFLETVERYVDELQHPKTFKRLFDQLVSRRGDSYFDWYRNCLNDFLGRLQPELELHRLTLTPLDELSPEVFDRVRRDGRQNVRICLVTDGDGQELAIYHRRPSRDAGRLVAAEERVPGIAFAVPNNPWSLEPYRRTRRGELHGLSDIWVQPDRPVRVFFNDSSGVKALSVAAAASKLADELRRGFDSRFVLPATYFGAARWLPKVNGGPG